MLTRYIFRLIIAASLFYLSSCGKEEQKPSHIIKAVKLLEVMPIDGLNYREISGVVTPAHQSVLSFRVSGQVLETKVKQGDVISKGQPIATLKQDEYISALNRAKASYESAQSTLVEQDKNLKRQRVLADQKFISDAQMETTQKDYDNAVANEEMSKESLHQAQRDLNDTVLTAPFAGTVATIEVDPFAQIKSGQTIVTLQNTDNFEVNLLMPETLINEIKNGDKVIVKVPSLEKAELKGIISEIGTQSVDGNAYSVVIALEHSSAELFSGMTAITYFTYASSEIADSDIYLIPTTAIDLRYFDKTTAKPDQTAPVYIYQPSETSKNQGTLSLRAIKINDIRVNMLEVIGGLKEGELIVIAGVSYLSDGQIVKPWQEKYQRPANEGL